MKIKKKNLMVLILCFFIFVLISFYMRLQPVFQIQAKTYFHEKVVAEIMNVVSKIEVPKDFIRKDGHQVSIDTNLLNSWIVTANEQLNQSMPSSYEASIPMGYFSGVIFFQNMGPSLSTTFLISQRIVARYEIKTTALGINNTLIELILSVECQGNVLLGFDMSELNMIEKIPLALEYVQGEVPQVLPY